MAVIEQERTEQYAIYNGDCCEVLPDLPDESVHFAVYSPPFADLYNYSSSERDLSNCRDYDEFLGHYRFVVSELSRLTKPGRINCVHCCDIAIPGQKDGYRDFPGDIIRLHKELGFKYYGRVCIWKEPFRIAMRTRLQHLTHKNIARDSANCFPAGADYILLFKRRGVNAEPITHPTGLRDYHGEKPVPSDLAGFAGEKRQQFNRLSQWIWRQYASAFWDDVRLDNVLPYKEAREADSEKHVCPLQLDVIERCIALWTNPGDVVLTPFMGVGSEVYTAVRRGRKAIGIELKTTYYRQASRNIESGLAKAVEGCLFAEPQYV